jgi:thymidylate kinase
MDRPYQPRGEGDQGLRETIQAELRVAPMPDVIIVLDLPVEIALDRIARKGNLAPLERPDRLAAAAKRYRRLCELLPVCRLVDATGDRASIASRVYAALERDLDHR